MRHRWNKYVVLSAVIAVLLGPAWWAIGVIAQETHYTVPSSGATFLSDLQAFLRNEDAARFADMFTSFVSAGGTHGTSAGLTGTPAALTAYPGGYYTTETGSITYPNNSTCWVIANNATTGDVSSFTRVSGTHYLRDCISASQPTLPSNSVYLMRVTTSGGAIAAVTDLRTLTPLVLTGSGITSLSGLTAASQLFAFNNDTNITLLIASAGNTHTFTVGWTGTLAASRLTGTDIATVGTITSGTWQGSEISTSYTAAKLATASVVPDRLVDTGTLNSPIFDIASNYVGQTSITTLGIVSTGTWQGTAIADAYLAALSASKLTGTALPAGIVTSSLTSVGTIGTGTWQGSIIGGAYGGTGNGFFAVSGPASTLKTFTFPNASANVLTDNAVVTVAQGGTGAATLTANNVLLGNATSAVQFVAPGTSGNVLTSNGTTWTSEAAAGGKVVQIVTATYAVAANSSTSTYADTGLTATITPTSASNKVLVIVFQAGVYKDSNNTAVGLKLFRGTTELALFEYRAAETGTTATNAVGASGITYLDSPATTNATTYKTQFNSLGNAQWASVQTGSATSSIALLEVTP